MAFRMEQLIRTCREMDDQIQHILEGIGDVREDISHLELRVNQMADSNNAQSFLKIRNLICDQESLCSNVRVFKDLLLEGFRMFSQDKPISDRNEIQRLNSDLAKQYAINMNMKKEVLELNELITDHIQMSRKKLDERDKEIIAWKIKYEKLLERNLGSIKIEEEEKRQPESQKQEHLQHPKHSLQTIKEQSQANNSNIKTDERHQTINQEFRFDDPIPSTHIDFSTEASKQVIEEAQIVIKSTTEVDILLEEVRIPSAIRTEQSERSQKSSSKNKIKYFIDDFRRASGSQENRDSHSEMGIPTPTSMRRNPKNLSDSRKCQTSIILQPYVQEIFGPLTNNSNQNNPSANISSSSSHSHLSIAENQNDGLWLPYKNTSPKKLDFSRNKNPWRMINKKSIPSKESNSLSEIKMNNQNIITTLQTSQSKNKSARKQTKIFTNAKKEDHPTPPVTFVRPASASKEKLRDIDQNNFSRVSRPNSKEKLTVTIKNCEPNSPQVLKRPQRRVTPQKRLPTEMQYLQRLDLQVGSSTEDLRYEGPRKQGLRNGNGKIQYSSGIFYEGQFKDNVRHGYGVLSVNGKVVYSGDWERDKICGSGTIKNMHLIHRPNKLTDSGFLSFLREAWYSGEFEQNRFHGNGTLFTNGEKIVGRFHDGHIEGDYSYCRKDGKVELCRADFNERTRIIMQYHR